jgi:hypothetical protein
VRKINASLIPTNKNFIQQRYIYDKQVGRAGLNNLHGLRHAYAQRGYKELTGFDAPISGGSKFSELNPQQKILDNYARTIISTELGHSRTQVTAIYVGR